MNNHISINKNIVQNYKIENLYNIFRNCSGISTDSRNILKDSIFFALKGENFNGNKFAANAINNGAKYAVIDDDTYYIDNDNYILVDDCLKSLQELAIYHRSKLSCPVIGITGTNGKTTTKELISGTLSTKYRTVSTKGNLNNHIGVPITILSANDTTEMLIVEMGANHIREIEQLCNICNPNYGLITTIGKAHLEGFGNIENIIDTKTALYRHLEKSKGTIFVNADDKILMSHLPASTAICTYGIENHDNTDCVGIIKNNSININFKWTYKDSDDYDVASAMYGKYNIINMLAAVCVGRYFDVNAKDICQFLNSYLPDNNRSQIIQVDTNTVISDAYNANPSSLKTALQAFNDIKVPHKTVILGDMFELGESSIEEHKNIVSILESMELEKVILIGKNFIEANKNFECYNTVEEAKASVNIMDLDNKIILIKGSRGMRLETLLKN